MNAPIFFCLLSVWLAIAIDGLRSPLGRQFPTNSLPIHHDGVDPGNPLFLTPYIEKGDIETGRRLANTSVPASYKVPISYSGFLTVNKTYNSNMFFWYFPNEAGVKDQPLLLWLQGGPGGSSLYGLFVENGPFGVDKNTNLFPRKFAWTSKYNVLYIDNPVGTGFSFTEHDAGYAVDETQVAENLYSALSQFFTLFPDLKESDFYLTGESYAGKYIPALAHRLHQDPPQTLTRFRGVAIGDGFTDPPVMIHQYAEYLFQIGLVDENERGVFTQATDHVGQLIDQGLYVDAYNGWLRTSDYLQNRTGTIDEYNYLRTQSPPDMNYYNNYLALSSVRKGIHVGNLTYNDGSKVEKFLIKDIMQSEKDHLAEVMNNYKVLLYSGQLDIIVALPLTEAMLQTVPWQYLDEYKRATKMIWKVNPSDVEVAGYVRRVHDFYQVLVRGGGHILPYDQPERSFDMIDRFITGKPFA